MSKTSAIRGVYLLTACKMSVEEKLRKLRGKRTLEILVNSRRGKFSSEFCRKWEIRVECTVVVTQIIWKFTKMNKYVVGI